MCDMFDMWHMWHVWHVTYVIYLTTCVTHAGVKFSLWAKVVSHTKCFTILESALWRGRRCFYSCWGLVSKVSGVIEIALSNTNYSVSGESMSKWCQWVVWLRLLWENTSTNGAAPIHVECIQITFCEGKVLFQLDFGSQGRWGGKIITRIWRVQQRNRKRIFLSEKKDWKLPKLGWGGGGGGAMGRGEVLSTLWC